MAHYSSLFTLGLLSDRASPPPSPKSNIFYQFRKSSLPTRMLSSNPPSDSGPFTPSASDRGLPQFTNPFAATDSREASTDLRSFLSLDLAADKCVVTRRFNNNNNNVLSPLDTNVAPLNLPPHQRMPSSSWHLPVSLPPVRRSSRDSLRTLPSPRPAPSSALPEVPHERKEPQVLPPIFIPSPTLFRPHSSSSRQAGSISPTSYRPPLSAPPTTSLSHDTSNPFIQTPPSLSPLSSPSFRGSRQDSFMSFSSTGTSIRTVRRRNVEHSNALACLEGRSSIPGRVPRTMRQRNFMSMSDDEDEGDDDEDAGGDADVEDDGDDDAPSRPSRTTLKSSSVPSTPNPSADADTLSQYRSPVDEEEDRVLPAAVTLPRQVQQAQSHPPKATTAKSRSRRSTLESWFPLANFIDLKDDELQGWRGVVEIANGL